MFSHPAAAYKGGAKRDEGLAPLRPTAIRSEGTSRTSRHHINKSNVTRLKTLIEHVVEGNEGCDRKAMNYAKRRRWMTLQPRLSTMRHSTPKNWLLSFPRSRTS
jgi:hypothetical protein